MSPTIFRARGLNFTIFTHDHGPAHVHVRAGRRSARVYLEDVKLWDNIGYKPAELRTILALVNEHRDELLRAWDEIHPGGR